MVDFGLRGKRGAGEKVFCFKTPRELPGTQGREVIGKAVTKMLNNFRFPGCLSWGVHAVPIKKKRLREESAFRLKERKGGGKMGEGLAGQPSGDNIVK